ncbi:uncharacterized protein TRAVEDRAFT_117288 [Trametes versicolor FP-101664 SS1]|uniref:uncharacterized protein n=1 Tax=Trametes versicolor (strain FP-101664) TaxID=717944 RepID=UPI0004622D91|nr:uncharacterized protein TRAVEDRAFT_117288 [Trametes versicolor FP-101664 SS1]EIW61159.1 hypothetical protein TRAVEDRAFT_117288 [Trametes versicolor FP-101664 SS1]
MSSCDSFIFDLADVFPWTSPPGAIIPMDTIRRMMHSTSFLDYERDRLGEDELYILLSSQFSLPVSHIADQFRSARSVRRASGPIIARVRHLKRIAPGSRVYGVWNISTPDWDMFLSTCPSDILAEFDQVLTSSHAGQRTSSPTFYRRLAELTGQDVARSAFISTEVEHLIAATTIGMTGVHYRLNEVAELRRTLHMLARDTVTDGEQWLSDQAGRMWSTTDTGVEIKEVFEQLLLLEIIGMPHLVNLPQPARRMQFFTGSPVLTTVEYPADIDTTSIACTVMSDRFSEDMKKDIMDDILALRNEDGITLMYYDPSRPRIDHVVCLNVLTFFHTNSRIHELPEMLDWVFAILKTRAYVWGTRYYLGADAFLYFLSRLLAVPSPLPSRVLDLPVLFKERVAERLGEPGDASALSMRLLAAAAAGLQDRRGYDRLLTMQDEDGAWPTGWMYKYGLSDILIGNKGLTTAMAVAAIRRFRELEVPER